MDGIGWYEYFRYPYTGGFYDYNTIKNTQIQEESVPNAIDTAGEDTRVAEVTESERDNKPDHGATEYAKQYQPDAEYDLKGIASDITSLDVEKAISDMKKDQVLQQYQFFVGERMSQTDYYIFVRMRISHCKQNIDDGKGIACG